MHEDNKQEKLETVVQQKSCYVFTIMETWWNDCHGWSAAIDVYKFFRREMGKAAKGLG